MFFILKARYDQAVSNEIRKKLGGVAVCFDYSEFKVLCLFMSLFGAQI